MKQKASSGRIRFLIGIRDFKKKSFPRGSFRGLVINNLLVKEIPQEQSFEFLYSREIPEITKRRGQYRHSWMIVFRGSCFTCSTVGVTRGVTGNLLRSRLSILFLRRRSSWGLVIHVPGKNRVPTRYAMIGVNSPKMRTTRANTGS
jgi:hypothetical protein